MKASIDDNGYLKIDAQALVQAMPDAVLRDLAKYALFNELLLTGILEALVDGQMWQGEDQPPWWFDQDTFTKLRLKLLPLLPEITAEAVRHIERRERQARSEKDRWNAAAWKLWHAWPDRSTRPEMPSWAYEHHEAMTKEQAESHLRSVEATIAAERSELDQLRSQLATVTRERDELKEHMDKHFPARGSRLGDLTISDEIIDDLAELSGPIEKLKLDLSDPHTQAVWEAVQAAKREVASWPAWKSGAATALRDARADIKLTESERDDLGAQVERLTRERDQARDAHRMMAAAYDGKVAETAKLRRLLREACEQWESWVNTEGQYPWGESPECQRITAIRAEAGIE